MQQDWIEKVVAVGWMDWEVMVAPVLVLVLVLASGILTYSFLSHTHSEKPKASVVRQQAQSNRA